MIVINLIIPKALAKQGLLFNKLTSDAGVLNIDVRHKHDYNCDQITTFAFVNLVTPWAT